MNVIGTPIMPLHFCDKYTGVCFLSGDCKPMPEFWVILNISVESKDSELFWVVLIEERDWHSDDTVTLSSCG